LLSSAGVKPDFSSSGNIRYTHRSLSDREIYFISNRTGLQVSDTCIFRDGTLNAELWNPVTGEISPVECSSTQNKTISVSIKLEAYQSFMLVFYHKQKSEMNGSTNFVNFPVEQTLVTLDGSWNVEFDTTWGGPKHVVFDSLTDWSKRPEDGIRYYSGIAVYTKSFDLPDNYEKDKNSRYFMDLGKLKNLGRIKLNGIDLGVIWTSPWQVDISDVIKKSDNHLEVEVANLWINRLIGDESQPWDGIIDDKWPEWLINGTPRESKRYTFVVHRYYKKDDPLSESGLLGPVSIKISKNFK
jgi:hypothetical protein